MPNMKLYDHQEEARLVEAKASHESKRSDLAKRIHEMYEGDKGWDAEQIGMHAKLKAEHDFAKDEMARIDSELQAMQATKPVDASAKKRKVEQDALTRFLKRGNDGLEAWEVDQQKTLLGDDNRSGPGVRSFAIPIDNNIFKATLVPGDPTPSGGVDGDVGQEQVMPGLVHGLHDFGSVVDGVTIIRTSHGNVVKYPQSDDGTTKADVKTDYITATTVKDAPALTEVEIKANRFDTGFTDISRYQEEDVAWSVGDYARGMLRRRMGRLIEEQLVVGTGAGAQMQGIQTIAKEVTTAKATRSVRWEDLVDLKYSINRAYLRGEAGIYGYPNRPGRIGFVTSHEFMGYLSKLQDGENRPLLLPGLNSGSYEMLLGYPIFISEDITDKSIPSTGADTKRPILFGNFGYHVLRYAGAALVIEQHYDSVTALENKWRFMGRIRVDARHIAPLTSTKSPCISIAKTRNS